jgi:AraC-like DNA-binding protein
MKENILRKSVFAYLYASIASSIAFVLLFYFSDATELFYLELLYTALNISLCVQLYKNSYNKIRVLIPFYFNFIAVFLYPIVLLFWKEGLTTGILWYTFIPIGVLLHNKNDSVKKWSIIVIVLIVSIITIQNFVSYNGQISELHVKLFNFINTIVCLTYISLSIFFYVKIYTIEEQRVEMKADLPFSSFKQNTDNPMYKSNNKENGEKYNELFQKIQTYFETKQPYKLNNFNIAQLSSSLNSNVKYVSLAISSNTGNNFNNYVNQYRIEEVKKMFDEGLANRYSIEYIYSSAGFKYQATFNDAFKKISGMTPTEYLRNRAYQVLKPVKV